MLKNKTALITGTNRGIGKALMEEFAKNGTNIIAHARKETPEFLDFLTSTAQKYNVNISPIFFDLLDSDKMKSEIQKLSTTKKTVNILINNAGILKESLLQMTPMTMLKEMFEVNFFAPYHLTQLVSRLMIRQKGGCIINISSISALEGIEGQSAYGATKAALISASKSAAKELGAFNIRVNCLAPGITKTDLMENTKPEVLKKKVDETYLKRIANPEDIAKVAVLLASDASEYITGQVIRVDGGRN